MCEIIVDESVATELARRVNLPAYVRARSSELMLGNARTTNTGAAVVVLGDHSELGVWTADVIRRLRAPAPSSVIFVASTQRGTGEGRRERLAHAGLDGLFHMTNPSEMRMLESVLTLAKSALLPERALHQPILTGVEGEPLVLIQWILRNGFRRPTIEQAAATFCVSTRTITRWLHTAGAPNFATLKGLAMLLAVRELESRNGLSRRHTVQRLGYVTAATVTRLAHQWRPESEKAVRYPRWVALLRLYPE